MLAAIGVGILSKQVHVMIGITSVSGKPLEVLSKIPESLNILFSSTSMEIILPALLGILSLLILVFYSRLRSRFFKLIPAPMWVVFLAIGLNYYYDLVSSREYPIGSNLLISLLIISGLTSLLRFWNSFNATLFVYSFLYHTYF